MCKLLSFVPDSRRGIDCFHVATRHSASDVCRASNKGVTRAILLGHPLCINECELKIEKKVLVFFIIGKWCACCPRRNGKLLKVVKGIRRRFVFEAPFSKWEGKKKNSSVTVESFLKRRSEMARSRFSDYIEKVKLRPFCRFIVHSTNFCQNAHSWSSLLNTVSSKSHWWNVRFLHVAEETAVLCVTPSQNEI